MGTSGNDDFDTVSDGSTTKTDSETETETDEECRSVRDSTPFEVDERVYASNKGLLYNAKVLKREYRKKKWFYYIHYFGWKKRYDEWVGEERLVKMHPNKLPIQPVLDKKSDLEKNMKSGDISLSKSNTSVGRGKKRENDSFNKEKSDVPSEKIVGLQISLSLKRQLISDYEYINHYGKLVTLPRNPSVDLILKKYLDYRLKNYNDDSEIVEEILCGLRLYFDKALQMMLLYKNERRQFANAIGKKVPPSKVYGAEHLLRLFVKFPELLARANIEEETLMELQEVVGDLLKFLQENQKDYFQRRYFVLADAETSTNK